MKKEFLILIALIILTIVPVQAAIVIDGSNVTSSSIMWQWPSGLTLVNVSIDGMYVCNFNPTSDNFVLSGLGANEPHTITLITATDTGSNTTSTLTNANTEQSTDFMTLLNDWWYLILIVVLCLVGMKRGLGIFLIVASGVSLYALVAFLAENPMTGSSNPLIEIPFLIYVTFFIIPLFLCYMVKGGITK
jgi:hypothetical protein